MSTPRLHAQRLCRAGLPQPATEADRLDLSLAPGEMCWIIGPGGGGKTAWLRTLGAVDPPGGGQLILAGTDCATLTLDQWRELRRRVGFIGTGAPLLSTVDGLANVLLPAQYHRLDTHDALVGKAHALLERLNWSGPLHVLPAYLSAHERHVLSLARTLMLEPVVLFIDEPFQMAGAGGWPTLGATLTDLAERTGLTTVIATNHLPYARHHAGHVLFTDPEGVRHFESWTAFSSADATGVQRFVATHDHAFEGT